MTTTTTTTTTTAHELDDLLYTMRQMLFESHQWKQWSSSNEMMLDLIKLRDAAAHKRQTRIARKYQQMIDTMTPVWRDTKVEWDRRVAQYEYDVAAERARAAAQTAATIGATIDETVEPMHNTWHETFDD